MEVNKDGRLEEEITDDTRIGITGLGIFVLENLLLKELNIPENVMDKFTDCWNKSREVFAADMIKKVEKHDKNTVLYILKKVANL